MNLYLNQHGVTACAKCGHVYKIKTKHICKQRRNKTKIKPVKQKLGDWTERQFKSVGVTQERYKEAKERFGLSPTCSCNKRIAWLNKVSDWWNNNKE